jgi:serine/threonine protein kinase
VTRYCPVCGLPTDAPFCPEDGVATLERVKAAGSGEVKNGDLVAKYRISGKLGKGGFGAVFSAVHTGTGQSVALKMLLSEDADESEIRRFHREARITAGLQHPNTVRVFDVGQTESGSLYIAMELLQGGSLEEELRQRGAGGILTQTEAIELAIPVLKALSEAHSQSLVHRDLKPGNIMYATIDGERVVKVLDFGIARINDSSLTGTGRSLGTPAYMSPEQVLGGNLDGRSDLYALGVILYRCVAGKLPFSDPNPLSVLYSHMHVPAPDLAATARTPVSVAFVDLVMRALAKEPDRRFANAREMRIALEAIRGLPEAELSDGVAASAAAETRPGEQAWRAEDAWPATDAAAG